MSEWISVDDEIPGAATRGVHDAFPVLVMLNEPYGKESHWNIKVCVWMNGSFSGFPAGATRVTHWMPLPEPPNDL